MRKPRPGATEQAEEAQESMTTPSQHNLQFSSLLNTGPVNSENLSLALLEDQPDDLKDKTHFIQELFILADSAENKM